jgi:hypothetical protein
LDPRPRALFNASFSVEEYQRYAADLIRRSGSEAGFRMAETPVFLAADFRGACETAAREIMTQLSEPARIARMRSSLPARWTFANETPLPSFAAIDFAAVLAPEGHFVPKVIELQGFPSLFAFEVMQHDAWLAILEEIGLGDAWTCWFGGRSRAAYLELVRRTIIGDCDPLHVAMVDIDPPNQKTVCDFTATKKLFGVDALDPRALIVRGRKLWRKDDAGREIRVERIYNRTILDELEHRRLSLPFDPHDELDVQWAPHPNWFFTWSKASLPFLDHPAVPRTRLLADVAELPADLSTNYVLKPLFSFAGSGVNLQPTRDDIAAIPAGARSNWCLQEKIEYGPAINAPDGGHVKLEVRMMFVRPDDAPHLELAINLCRLSRGAMLSVDFNRGMTWVGSTVGLWREPDGTGS